MNREGHEHTDFFLGTEVEHSPAYGKKTLFVIGLKSTEEIDKFLHDACLKDGQAVDHIYFGADHSFDLDQDDYSTAKDWADMISAYLDKDMLCTLDFDVRYAEMILDMCLDEYDNFIPMISVKIPYTKLLNYNTTVKIDDVDFRATNPGVWCHSLHTLMDRSVFTDWRQYKKDTVLK